MRGALVECRRVPRSGQGWFVRVAGAALALTIAAACANDARDAHCEPDGSDDRCISEPEGAGPFVQEAQCTTPSADEPLPDSCPDFAEVFDFMVDPTRG